MSIDINIIDNSVKMEDLKVIILKENGYEGIVLKLDEISFENNSLSPVVSPMSSPNIQSPISNRKVTIKGVLSGDTESFTIIKGAVPDKVIEHILAWQRVSNSGEKK